MNVCGQKPSEPSVHDHDPFPTGETGEDGEDDRDDELDKSMVPVPSVASNSVPRRW